MSKKLNPDIKISPKGVAYIPTETLVKRRLARINKPGTEAEHQRLKDEVVEASRLWRRAQGDASDVTEVDGMRLMVVRAWSGLRKAVDALIKFEAENKAE